MSDTRIDGEAGVINVAKVTLQYEIEIKEKIIRSAIRCFSIAGRFDRTRMDDIQSDRGSTRARYTSNLENKEDLSMTICQNRHNRIKGADVEAIQEKRRSCF